MALLTDKLSLILENIMGDAPERQGLWPNIEQEARISCTRGFNCNFVSIMLYYNLTMNPAAI